MKAAQSENTNPTNEKASVALIEIEKAKKDGANLLLPSTTIEGLSEFHSPVVDKVYLNPDPQAGDVYLQQRGNQEKNIPDKYAITRQGLMKLSVCAGIIWHPTECRRTDNRTDRHYVAFKAIGGIRKADGTPVFFKAEYDIDFEVVEQELLEQYTNKCKNWRKSDEQKRAYVESGVRRDLLFKRKHKMKLAESGAMNRVIRALLGLKGTYTQAELQKPFVMVRIVLKPDYTDEKVREKMTEMAMQSQTGIYGPAAANPPIDLPHEDIIDVPAAEDEAGAEPVPEDPLPDDPDPEPKDSRLVDFENSEKTERIKTLNRLVTQKAYDKKRLPKPIEDLTDGQMSKFFTHLSAMEDDDIPF